MYRAGFPSCSVDGCVRHGIWPPACSARHHAFALEPRAGGHQVPGCPRVGFQVLPAGLRGRAFGRPRLGKGSTAGRVEDQPGLCRDRRDRALHGRFRAHRKSRQVQRHRPLPLARDLQSGERLRAGAAQYASRMWTTRYSTPKATCESSTRRTTCRIPRARTCSNGSTKS